MSRSSSSSSSPLESQTTPDRREGAFAALPAAATAERPYSKSGGPFNAEASPACASVKSWSQSKTINVSNTSLTPNTSSPIFRLINALDEVWRRPVSSRDEPSGRSNDSDGVSPSMFFSVPIAPALSGDNKPGSWTSTLFFLWFFAVFTTSLESQAINEPEGARALFIAADRDLVFFAAALGPARAAEIGAGLLVLHLKSKGTGCTAAQRWRQGRAVALRRS
mmetsp:Transcript_9066/g.26441  ORF Transcript_9066/g.26441 Transcript_9066/m.26441 type:complete len:222 (+) Transcript_9066:2449-3114(+)